MESWDLSKEGMEARYEAAGQTGLGTIEKAARNLMLNLAYEISKEAGAYDSALAKVVEQGAGWSQLTNLVEAEAARQVGARISRYLEHAHKEAEGDLGGIEEVYVLRKAVNRSMSCLSLGTSTNGVSNELDRAQAKRWLQINERLMNYYNED